MKEAREHCTCQDTTCPAHPVNHEKGCFPCIQKNLVHREVPSCFFLELTDTLERRKDFSYHAFAELVYAKVAKKPDQSK
ncbi:MAG: DUF6485 family protein [Spirochaetia bacterium]